MLYSMLYQNSTVTPLFQVPSPEPNLIMIGDTQYGFYKKKPLGSGFGGTIYEGRKITDSSLIAVKILNANSLIQNHIPLKELIELTSKNHIRQSKLPFFENHLVEVIDVIQMDKTLMIMQLCEYNLSEFVSYKKSLSEPQILQILKNIIQALITVQNQGYHFADLKPENILITKDGSAKLGDLDSLIKLHKLDKNVQLKFQKWIFGTLRYMPPELIGLGQHSSQNYIWSLGVIVHEIIYGHPPFDVQKYDQNLKGSQKFLSINTFYQQLFNLKICQSLSREYPKCHFILKKMLRFNAKNRIDLLKILNLISDSNQATFQSQTSSDYSQVKKSRTNSQNTIDTTDEHNNQSSNCSLKFQNKNQRWKNQNQHKNTQSLSQKSQKNEQKNQNQKQSEPMRLCGHVFHHKNKDKGQRMLQFYERFKETYEQQTLKLIKQISSPIILVRKLNHFHAKMTNLLQKLEQVKESKNQKDHHIMVKSIWHEIKASKVYSHLETTMRIEHLQIEFERNHRQVNLWKHLNEVIQMARIHLISFETQEQAKFDAN